MVREPLLSECWNCFSCCITLNARNALTRERRLVEMAAELLEPEVELERLATVDPLIGVLNRGRSSSGWTRK